MEQVEDMREHYLAPLSPCPDFHNHVGLNLAYCGEQYQFSCEELVAMMLRQLASYAEKGETKETYCVLSIPGCFTKQQRQALRAAAHIAGLNISGFINDLTAAALVYSYTRSSNLEDGDVVLFVDMGQCYFQLQVVEYREGRATVLASHAEELGGREFTARLKRHLESEIMEKYKLDVTKSSRNVWQMTKEAERLKKVLSTIPATKFDYFIMDKDVSINVNRARFEELCNDLLVRIAPAVEKVKQAAQETLKKQRGDSFSPEKFEGKEGEENLARVELIASI